MNASELTLEISGRWQLLSVRVNQWANDCEADRVGVLQSVDREGLRKRIRGMQEQHCDLEREWSAGVYRVREMLFEIIEKELPPAEFAASITLLLDRLENAADRLLKNRLIMVELSTLLGIAVPNPVGLTEGNAKAAIRGMRELAQCLFGPHHSDEENRELEAVLFPA